MQKPSPRSLKPEEQKVMDRMMQNAIRLWDAELIRRAAETGADTQDLFVESIRKKDAEMLKLALDFGAETKGYFPQSEKNFQPVLHFAHAHYNEDVLSTLLDRGVSVDQKNTLGETVADVAAQSGDFDKLRFYRDKGADLSASLQNLMFSAVRKKDVEMLNWCLDQGADVKATCKNTDGVAETALHIAVNYFDEAICDTLLRRGLPVDVQTSTGETALIRAARGGKADKTAYFIKHGADPLRTTHAGLSALDVATSALETALAAEKKTSSYDEDRWHRSSTSSSALQTRKEETARVRENLTILLDAVKAVHGVDPYKAETQRRITVSKPIQKPGKTPPPEGM